MAQVDPQEWVETPEERLTALQQQWLKPLGPLSRWARRPAFVVNRALVRMLFRVRAVGADNIPKKRPVVFTPNHTSSLDAPLLAAALPYQSLRHTRWAVRKGLLARDPVRTWINRLAQSVPVEQNSGALAAAACVIRRNENLVWFPEGARTRTGRLQEFQPGIGLLMLHLRVPAVPVYLEGAYETLPPGARWPRKLKRVRVHFGPPLDPGGLIDPDLDEQEQVDRLVQALRQRVAQLPNG